MPRLDLQVGRSCSFRSSAILASVVTLVSGLAACVAQPCTQSTSAGGASRELPSTVPECPSGTLCYQGACMPSCSAGSELAEECESSSACNDPARPNCVDGFCSGCNEGEVCLPALNICAPVSRLQSDAGPGSGRVEGNDPLDGGGIDGSVLPRDSGVVGPVQEVRLSHLGVVQITQFERPGRNPATTSSVTVQILDIRDTGYVPTTTSSRESDGLQHCQLVHHERFPLRPPVPADMGDVTIEGNPQPDHPSGFLGSIVLKGKYNSTVGYVVAPPPPSQLLNLSPTEFHYITVYGAGKDPITAGAWPPGGKPTLWTAFQLQPAPETLALLSGVITAPSPTAAPLVFKWDRRLRATPVGVKVVVFIAGPESDLECNAPEDPAEIRLSNVVLQRFAQQPGVAGSTRELLFARVAGQQLEVKPGAGLRIKFVEQNRHAFAGQIRF